VAFFELQYDCGNRLLRLKKARGAPRQNPETKRDGVAEEVADFFFDLELTAILVFLENLELRRL
jgi:hypothetical protein